MPKNPEFSRGAEMADQSELSHLFDQAKAQIRRQGEHRPLRPDVQRAKDGLPILTAEDAGHETTDGYAVQLETRSIIHFLPRTAANLEIEDNAVVDLLYIPEHYQEDIEQSGSGVRRRLKYNPSQVEFGMPKNQQSVFDEDNIRLRKRPIGTVEAIEVSRDKIFRDEYKKLKIGIGDHEKGLDFMDQFMSVEDVFNVLTTQEAADLLAVIRSVPLTRG
jgi:hypothetical protein